MPGKATSLPVCDCHVVLVTAHIAAVGVTKDDIESFGVPDPFLYVLNFWHSVVSPVCSD